MSLSAVPITACERVTYSQDPSAAPAPRAAPRPSCPCRSQESHVEECDPLTMTEYRLDVPFLDARLANEPNPCYRGLLVQHGGGPEGPLDRSQTEGRPLAIFVHGMASHKNGLMFATIAQQLRIDSYRFDQRGEGESPGEWTNGAYDVCAAPHTALCR